MAAAPKIELSFNHNELLAEGSDYVIVDRTGKPRKAGGARYINRGGAGVVYRARFKGMERALKFLSPRNIQQQPELFDRLKHTFETEITILSKVTHTHIAKIVDFGEVSRNGQVFPYYAMEHIDGKRIDDIYRQDPDFDAAAFLKICEHVLDALGYLHDRGIMHSDVKEENILVRKQGGSFEAILVDLGASKVVRAVPSFFTPSFPLGADTYFFSSEKATRPERHRWLGKQIPRDRIIQIFPDHDLFAFGRIVERTLAHERVAHVLEAELSESGVRALYAIKDRLLSPADRPYYHTAGQVRRDISKLSPAYLSPLGVPEMSLAANVETSVPLPLGRVSLTPRMCHILNHPLFQRLRLIPQLEFVYLLYPGARHSRLMHSLSSFNLAREYIAHLLNDPQFRLMAEPEHIEATLLWALLHDIGQYPLSHMFEDFAEEERGLEISRRIPTDEDLFWSFVCPSAEPEVQFLSDYSRIIEEELEHTSVDQVPPLHELVRREFGDSCLTALRSIGRPTEPVDFVLAGLLNSPIDFDKVAYLTDDSAMTGLRYGGGIDLDGLLSSLIMPRLQDIQAEHRPLIAISDKGLSAAESIVLARYWMLRRAYWHRTNRAIMCMAKFVISHLMRANLLDFSNHLRETLFETEIEAARRLAEQFDRAIATNKVVCATPVINPLHGILRGNRFLHKRLLTISHGPSDREMRLHKRIAFHRWEELSGLVSTVVGIIETHLGATEQIREGDILLDVPVKQRELMGGKVLVYLDRDPERGMDLYSGTAPVSPLLASLRAEFDYHVKKCRIFVSPWIYERLEPVIGKVRDDVRQALEEVCGVV
ncbi:protein kinase [Dehalococcoidia bacterium]|nr:protein kinase [Dehalococcoidia bacterium]